MQKVILTRSQINRNSIGVDTTVKLSKGIARRFAPTWTMVMGHKNKTITDQEYIEQYNVILDSLLHSDWEWLYDQAIDGKVNLLCFCRGGNFCHTYLIAEYAEKHNPEMFINQTR